MIPFLDVATQNKQLKKQMMTAIEEVIDSSDFILGNQVRELEKEFADYCESSYAAGVNSGTDALFLGLLSVGVGPGDEVICPGYTYIATALSISYTGAKPVFVDIDEDTYNIDPSKIEESITKKTKAIIPVHLYGLPSDMGPIMKIAKKYKLAVIEDAAQAHGASWKNSKGKWLKVGGIGDVGCFSFYPTKNLGACGDAGMMVAKKKKIYERILMLRDQGRKGKQRHLHYIRGYNSRLASIQAACLRVKFKHLEQENKNRQKMARLYSKLLKNCQEIKLPVELDGSVSVYHIYAVRTKKRNALFDHLCKKNIFTAKTYPVPLHLQPAYKDLGYKQGDFPIAEQVSPEVLCLPMYGSLTESQVKEVAEAICDFYGGKD